MKTVLPASGFVALLTFLAGPSWSQTTTQPAASAPAQPAAATTAPADRILATVNGRKITESEVNEVFNQYIKERMQGRALDESHLAQMRVAYQPQIRDMLVEAALLDAEIEKHHLQVTEAELHKELTRGMDGFLVRRGLTREEFSAEIQEQHGVGLDEFLKKRAAEPMYRQTVLQTRLLEKLFPERVQVSDDEIREHFEKNKSSYDRPEMVKASHILISTDGAVTNEDRAAARQKAEEALAEARKPDADFAKVAMAHSACPSKERGGDMGYFPRHGAMVEPFAEAAFKMKVGEISDVVETPFGYHIIKLTDRKAAESIPLEKVKDLIFEEIRRQKLDTVRKEYLAELRAKAEIVVVGQETPTTRPSAAEATTRPVNSPPPAAPPPAGEPPQPTTSPA